MMRYTQKLCLLTAIWSLILLNSCSQGNNINKPDDCGKHLFALLKDFDPDKRQQFADGFLSLETIHKLSQDRSQIRDPKRKSRFAKMTESGYDKEITGYAYDIIDKEGYAFGIVWKDIKYVGFIYKDQRYDNMRSIKGKLVFEYKDRQYDVGCVYVKYDEKWQLAAISGLYMHGVNNPVRPKPDQGLIDI